MYLPPLLPDVSNPPFVVFDTFFTSIVYP